MKLSLFKLKGVLGFTGTAKGYCCPTGNRNPGTPSGVESFVCVPLLPRPPNLSFASPSAAAVTPLIREAIGYATPTALSLRVCVIKIGPRTFCLSITSRKAPLPTPLLWFANPLCEKAPCSKSKVFGRNFSSSGNELMADAMTRQPKLWPIM